MTNIYMIYIRLRWKIYAAVYDVVILKCINLELLHFFFFEFEAATRRAPV